MNEYINAFYIVLCYIGIASSLIGLIFTDKEHRAYDYIIPQCIIGIGWMVCLQTEYLYSMVIVLFNILVLGFLPDYIKSLRIMIKSFINFGRV